MAWHKALRSRLERGKIWIGNADRRIVWRSWCKGQCSAHTHTHMHACMQCLLQETYIGQEVSGPRTRATDFVGVETGSCATVSSVALSDGVHILGHGQILTLSMTSNILYHI